MAVFSAAEFDGIFYFEYTICSFDDTAVAFLTAHGSVERSFLYENGSLLAFHQRFCNLSLCRQNGYFGGILQMIVSGKLSCYGRVDLIVNGCISTHVVCYFTARSCTLSLLFHCCMETVLVDAVALLLEDLFGQIQRESVGIVQFKCILSVQNFFAFALHFFFELGEDTKSLVDGFVELGLLVVQNVEDTIKLRGGKYGHVGVMKSGMISNGEKVTHQVNEEARKNIEKNHSATHLLQKALKTVLGAHVEQKGSLVTPTRLRFDFAHFQAMTPEELEKVENLVNEKIQEQIPVVTDIMDTEEAKKSGAMALFGEKYGDKVRVVSMGDFSKELCGGTHVKNTAEIGLFKLVSEAGVAAGVRRIEALTGPSVTAYYKAQEEKIHEAAALLKTTPADLLEKIAHLQAEAKALQAENESLKSKLAKEALGDVMDKVTEVKGVKLLAASVPDVDMNGLRDLGDQLKEKLGSGVVVLASAKDGKVSLLAMVTDDAMKKGAHAGKLIKEVAAVVGGGGGGRPNMAQAGGKNPEKIDEAVAKAAEVLEGQIA